MQHFRDTLSGFLREPVLSYRLAQVSINRFGATPSALYPLQLDLDSTQTWSICFMIWPNLVHKSVKQLLLFLSPRGPQDPLTAKHIKWKYIPFSNFLRWGIYGYYNKIQTSIIICYTSFTKLFLCSGFIRLDIATHIQPYIQKCVSKSDLAHNRCTDVPLGRFIMNQSCYFTP